MDFFSKFTKPDQSKPASAGQEPNSATEPSSTDLFGSAKVVAGAAQSYFSHQPATYENAEVAGATADILDAASEYGKLDKTQGVGKYVDQAESYLKEYKASNTTTTPAAKDSAADAGVKPAPTTEAGEADTAATKGPDASTVKSTEPGSYGDDTTQGLPSKQPAGDTPSETDGFSKKASGDGVATETVEGGDYIKPDGFKEGISDKPSKGGAAAEADSGDSGYTEDTEEGLPKPSAGGYAAGHDASEKVSPAEGGFGNFTKVAGDFLNK